MSTPLSASTFSSSVTQTRNPLVANYSLTIPDGSQVRVQFGLSVSYGTYTWWVPAPAGGGVVSVLVAGMLPGSAYHMSAIVQEQNGTIVNDVDYTFNTGELPLNNMPALTVNITGTPSPGVELVNLNPLSPVVIDLDGNIIWYYFNQEDLQHHGHPMPIKQLPNGNMMALITNRYTNYPEPYSVLREVDLASDTVTGTNGFPREIHMKDLNAKLMTVPTKYGRTVQVNYYSHDFLPLPNGHVILICQEFVKVAFDGKINIVWGDALVDLDETFQPVWVWSAFDVLDMNRHPFEWGPTTFDWTHCNCIQSTPDGNLLLSVRNQSWVLKLDYADGAGTGAIVWRLGYGGDFTLASGAPDNWFFQQHYPNILTTSPDKNITTISVVDNGNQRIDTKAEYSRGLLLSIDETQKTADVTWQYPVTPDFFSYWGGDVVPLPNSNIEICMSRPYSNHSFAREVTTDQQLVWEMDVHPAFAYRSYRIPSLYPNVQW